MTPEVLYSRMNSVPRKDAALCTAAILDKLQHYPVHVQMVATCMVFWRLCVRLRIRTNDVMSVVNNLFSDGVQPASEFRATDLFIDHFLKAKE